MRSYFFLRGCAKPSPIIAGINFHPAFKSAPKSIGAPETYGQPDIFNAVVPTGKPTTRLIKPQPLNELGRRVAKLCLESSAKVPWA
jgi:hypothetical protein